MAVGSRLARVAAATLARGNTLAMKKHMRGFERRAAHLDRLKHRVELTQAGLPPGTNCCAPLFRGGPSNASPSHGENRGSSPLGSAT